MKGIGCIVGIAALGLVLILGFSTFMWGVGVWNTEASLRNQFTAKQTDNKNAYDNMWKKIAQTAQVPQMQAEALKCVLDAYVKGRGSDGGSLFKSVTEAVPNLDQSVYLNLMNMIAAARDSWQMNQTMLLDIKREHDNLRTKFPSCLICSSKPALEAIIITSGRTEKAFETGKDDDIDLIPVQRVERQK